MPTKTSKMPDAEKFSRFASEFAKDIEAADTITLFRHILPDPDAFGSQLGLKSWLQEKYPDKKILALGKSSRDHQMDEADDEEIRNSLAIILDSSTSPRIDDERWKDAKKSIRIDHHVLTEEFGDLSWVDEDATATCEILALLLEKLGQKLPQEAAQLLYEGLIADNLRFSVNKTSPDSFAAGAYLVSNGVDLAKANTAIFAGTYHDFVYENRVRSNAYRNEKALISVMSVSDYLNCGHDFMSAKDMVYVLSNIVDIEVWALFTMMEDGIHYSASLRSRTIPIRDIAAEYGGGGHDCASGIKNLTSQQVAEIAEKLAERSTKPDFKIV